jgi:hypothetical protein
VRVRVNVRVKVRVIPVILVMKLLTPTLTSNPNPKTMKKLLPRCYYLYPSSSLSVSSSLSIPLYISLSRTHTHSLSLPDYDEIITEMLLPLSSILNKKTTVDGIYPFDNKVLSESFPDLKLSANVSKKGLGGYLVLDESYLSYR